MMISAVRSCGIFDVLDGVGTTTPLTAPLLDRSILLRGGLGIRASGRSLPG